MIDTLVIIVYDRYDNLKKWFSILEKCQRPKNIVVIHNINDGIAPRYRTPDYITYIPRDNVGFDIGAFQDVCKGRLEGFPDWEQLLWCTDDTFPMQPDFINKFALKQGEGVRCMEVSPYVREHIRTTGFSISRKVAVKLQFPADPVITKQHCYLFEHRDPRNTFMAQVRRMGLHVKMVAPKEISPLFDTGYHRRLKREVELDMVWGVEVSPAAPVIPKNPKVTIICPIYKSFPAIISSLIMQTYSNWELLLIHDGPDEGFVRQYVELVNDDRIKFSETPEHRGAWGHYIRSEYIQKAEGDFILVTNPDNYHTPVYLEYMLKGFGDGVIATYCESMVHSYKAWQVIPCMLKRGYLDCAGVLVASSAAKTVGWNNTTEHSADWLYFQDLITRFGQQSFMKIKGTLLIHN